MDGISAQINDENQELAALRQICGFIQLLKGEDRICQSSMACFEILEGMSAILEEGDVT